MLLSLYSSLFSQDQTTELKAMLKKLGLVPLSKLEEFAEVIRQTQKQIDELNQLSLSEVNDSLAAFNKAFDETPLVEILEMDKSSSYLKENIFKAFSEVEQEMGKNQKDLNLVYHNSGHAIEMFFDTFQLCLMGKGSLKVHLLMPLCALFHDIIFKNLRIKDEKASAATLKVFLEPILEKLAPAHQKIICNLIDVLIVGGTTPLLLNAVPLNKKKKPMQKTVFEVIELLTARKEAKNSWRCISASAVLPKETDSLMKNILSDMVNMMSTVDVQRTSIPLLHNPDNKFYNKQSVSPDEETTDWKNIEQKLGQALKIEQKKKLGQNFRMISEMILLHETKKEEETNPAYQWAQSLYDLQRDKDKVYAISASQALIPVIGMKLVGEMNFSQRMSNSANAYRNIDSSSEFEYPFKNTWNEHTKILKKLHEYFMDVEINVGNKIALVRALTRVSVVQDGKDISMDHNIAIVCEQLNAEQLALFKQEDTQINSVDVSLNTQHTQPLYTLRT